MWVTGLEGGAMSHGGVGCVCVCGWEGMFLPRATRWSVGQGAEGTDRGRLCLYA